MADLSDSVNWFEIDNSNNKASPNGWPEGMMPSGVNDSARADKGALKRFFNRINPTKTITKSGGVWTFVTDNPAYPTSYVDGEIYTFLPSTDGADGDQFQVNGLAAKPIIKISPSGNVPIVARDIVAYRPPQLIHLGGLSSGAGGFLLLNPYVPVTGDGAGGITIPGGITTGPIISTGPIGGLIFYDRNNSSISWTWYADGGLARLYSSGEKFSVDLAGGLTLGNYIHFGGSTGAVSGTGGPLLYADATNQVFKLGSGNGAWYFQNYPGTNVASLGASGLLNVMGMQTRAGISGATTGNYFNIQWATTAHLWIDNVDQGSITITDGAGNVSIPGQLAAGSINSAGTINAVQYNISGHLLATSDGTTTSIFDATGAAAIHLQAANSFYDADTHQFRNNVAANTASINSGGTFTANGEIISGGNLHSGGALFLGNPYILFNGNTSLGQGPLLVADGTNWGFRLGPGNGGFYFQNSGGSNVVTIDNAGSAFFTGFLSSAGHVTRAGQPPGAASGNHFNIEWRPGAHLWIDNADLGALVLDGGTGIHTSSVFTTGGFFTTDVNSGQLFVMYSSGNVSLIQFIPGWYLQFNGAGGQLAWIADSNVFWAMRYSDHTCLNQLGPVAGVGAYINSSDRRGKTDIVPTTKGLAEALRLSPVEFGRTSEPDRRELGFVAQDVEDVLPEAVRRVGITLPDGTGGLDDAEPSLGITCDAITACLVNAVKELHARLSELEAK